jgi:hypothetical protein
MQHTCNILGKEIKHYIHIIWNNMHTIYNEVYIYFMKYNTYCGYDIIYIIYM